MVNKLFSILKQISSFFILKFEIPKVVGVGDLGRGGGWGEGGGGDGV